jgi:hypothetical protein
MDPVIQPRKNRKIQRDYDKYAYRLRHLVENAFLRLSEGEGLQHATQSCAFLFLPQFK